MKAPKARSVCARLAAVLVATAATGLVAAPMFKWVDEKGVTHYSESPPADGGKATKIDVKPVEPSGGAQPAGENWKERELEFRARRLEKERAEDAGRARTEHEAATRKNRCLTARRQIDVLQHPGPVYSVNERGERQYLEDKDRAAQVEQWKRAVEAYCDR